MSVRKSCYNIISLYLISQYRVDHVIPKRMEEMKKAILDKNFESFAEITMKVSVLYVKVSVPIGGKIFP